MKRANNLLPLIMDPDNLRLAFYKAQRGKQGNKQVMAFRAGLDEKLLHLQAQILDGKLEIGDYRFFKIFDPKEREICASSFQEQVLHHALMNVCHKYFDRKQVCDSYASRPGKGTYAALARAKYHTHQHAFYLKLDVRKFFASIDHKHMIQQLSCLFKEKRLLEIFAAIIYSFEVSQGKGLPIGSLTSQYFANHYLSGLDHAIKEQLRIKGYVRYMDDMVLWSHDKDQLLDAFRFIKTFVEDRLKLNLKPEILKGTGSGLPFLGYLVFPHFTKLTQRSKRRFVRKMTRLLRHHETGVLDEASCQRKALPLLAFLSHADTQKLQKNVIFGHRG